VTRERWLLDGGFGVERRLGDGALLIAFLVKVSTKFYLIARATEDKVAQRDVKVGGGKVVPSKQGSLEAPLGAPWCAMLAVCPLRLSLSPLRLPSTAA
jgi:hypothetical protein